VRHIQYKRLYLDTKDIPDKQIFFVHKEGSGRTSKFVITPDAHDVACAALATKIRGKIYTSDYWLEDDKKWRQNIDKAMQQMATVIMSGWSIAGTREDEFGYPETVYRCVYCDLETTEPRGSCICRILERALQK